ncbi:MAG: Trm112 family protein [Zetaproteobacteria bacterium]|nr:MAG: Trm112 family protein [Zetaproteobacteria bacterium]
MIDDELLQILACPKCKGEVRLDREREAIVCMACRLAYPIRDGIPVMLIDEASPLDDAASESAQA